MIRFRYIAAILLAGLLALAPGLADARAGGSYRLGGGSSFMSQGSMGSRTYNQPMQRSMTPRTPPAGTAPYSYGNAHPFWTGLAGGLFGGWLGSMLFPHWGMGMGGFGGGIGAIFIWLLLFWGMWRMFRLFAHGVHPLTGQMGQMGGSSMLYGSSAMLGAGYGNPAPQNAPLALAGADYQAFETILKHIQACWSKADLTEMRHYATPEMLSYFAEQLAENESQGVRNIVDQVELVQGDPREAWDEGRLHYAMCYLRWRALDYTLRADRAATATDALVSGDPRRPTEAAELWTFVRSPGGLWLLSAIQQV